MKLAARESRVWHVPVGQGRQAPDRVGAATPDGAREQMRWITRLAVIPCPCCDSAVNTVEHSATPLPPLSFWRLDTRRTMVCCPDCRQLFWAYAHPLFNWVPSYRALAATVVLNGLVLLFLLTAV